MLLYTGTFHYIALCLASPLLQAPQMLVISSSVSKLGANGPWRDYTELQLTIFQLFPSCGASNDFGLFKTPDILHPGPDPLHKGFLQVKAFILQTRKLTPRH